MAKALMQYCHRAEWHLLPLYLERQKVSKTLAKGCDATQCSSVH